MRSVCNKISTKTDFLTQNERAQSIYMKLLTKCFKEIQIFWTEWQNSIQYNNKFVHATANFFEVYKEI